MDHKTLINKVAAASGSTAGETQELLDELISLIVSASAENDSVAIPAFGTFEARSRMERVSLHPVTGRKLLIPPKIVMGFKPSAVLKNRINQTLADE